MPTHTTKDQEQITGVNCYVGSNGLWSYKNSSFCCLGTAQYPGDTENVFSSDSQGWRHGPDLKTSHDVVQHEDISWTKGVFSGDSGGGPSRTVVGTAAKQCKKRCGWISSEPWDLKRVKLLQKKSVRGREFFRKLTRSVYAQRTGETRDDPWLERQPRAPPQSCLGSWLFPASLYAPDYVIPRELTF